MKCCDMTPGMLRTPFELRRQLKSDIGGGATALTYQRYAAGRCKFVPLSGGERLYAERIDATTRNRAVIRYRADIADSDQFVAAGRVYNIRFINNLEMRNRWLELDLDGGVPV